MSTRYSRVRDLTDRQPSGGGGMSYFRTFVLCGHKGSTTGAEWSKKHGAFIRCAACAKKSETR